MNGAFFNPDAHTLSIYVANIRDLLITEEKDGAVRIDVGNLLGGIEIFHDDDRLWRPA